jgi:hypothetical protein
MKKLILSLVILFPAVFIVCGQSLSLSNPHGPLSPGDTVHSFVSNNVDHKEHVYITNNSSSDIDVKIRKQTIQLVPGAFSTFCWGQCFSPTVEESPNPLTIPAGVTNEIDFYTDYNANGNDGVTIVRYIIFDHNAPSDSVDVVVKLTSTPASVDEMFMQKPEISNPYPNPATTSCQFKYNIPMNTSDARLIISDLTGHIVQSVQLAPGEGKVSLDVSSLNSGIYFYSLQVNNQPKTTRKLIVQR